MLPHVNGYNMSILSIPIHFILSMIPHAVAHAIAARGRIPTENSSNLRAQDTRAQLQQRVPAESYARYMRRYEVEQADEEMVHMARAENIGGPGIAAVSIMSALEQ
ncbi:hypothetical protein BM1_04191 [Bipolaris maydis]|nr:hypothetical protein BM1_04191 [Bipolaris maydis]